jgi:hypothetical protein
MSSHSRHQGSRSGLKRNRIMRKALPTIQRWAIPLCLGILALMVTVGIATVQATSAQAGGVGNLKQQAAQMQAQWITGHSHYHAAKVHLAPGAFASCAVNLNQSPIVVTGISRTSNLPYDSYINVISVDKYPYSILGEMNRIVVVERQRDMCNPHDTPIPARDFNAPGQPGQITVTAVDGDVVTFTTAAHTTGQFNYVTGQYLGA